MSEQRRAVPEWMRDALTPQPNDQADIPWAVSDEVAQTDGYRRWAEMAPEIMSEPVISSKFMADQLGAPEEAVREVFGDRISMSQYVEIATNLSLRPQVEERVKEYADSLTEKGVPEQMRQGLVEQYSAHMERGLQDQIDAAKSALITGKGTNRQFDVAQRALFAVAQHTPRGEYAQYAGRSPEEQAEAEKKYGDDADFNITPAGQQNYGAQRVHEFFAAASPDYEPASGWSQTWRMIGGPLASFGAAESQVYGGQKASDGNWLQDYRRMNQPGGKFDYAADAAERSRFDGSGEYNLFTEDGQAKFPSMSLYTPSGIVDAGFMNSSYPLGYATNAMFGNAQWGDFIGTALEKGIGAAQDRASAIRELRTQGFRITPHTIPGVSSEDMQKSVAEIRRNDAGSDAFASATLGPAFSKAMGVTPSYLSPFMSAATNVLGETVRDPINVAFQVAAPGLSAVNAAAKAAVGGGKTMIPRLASMARDGVEAYGQGALRSFKNIVGDTTEEVGESGVFGAMGGIGDLFRAQKTNDLIDNYGNGKRPDEEGYSAFDANVNRVAAGTEAAQPVIDAMRRARAKPTSMDYQRPPAGGRMQY